MGFTTTITDEYVSWESPFPMSMVVCIVAVCALLMVWTLYRERVVLGNANTWLFGLLRTGALATVVFMMLGPVSVLEESSTTKKAIAVMTDVSASMTTVDPAGSADDVRWAAMQIESLKENPAVHQIQATDRAKVSLGITQQALVKAIEASGQTGAPEILSRQVLLADQASKRTRQHLAELDELSDATTQSFLARLNQLLDSPEFDSLSELAREFERGRTPSESGWREGLSDLMARAATATRVLNELNVELLEQATSNMESSGSRWRRFQSQSRSQRVASLLETIQSQDTTADTDIADWRWSVFDADGRSLANQQTMVQSVDQLGENEDATQQTDLSGPLELVNRMRAEQPVAATFIFTDVSHNYDQERLPAEVASQIKDSPIYFVPIGNSSRLRDVDLASVSAPSVAMRNDNVVLEATLEVYQCVGETCVVQLLSDGEVVDFRNVLIDSNAMSRTVRFDQRVSEIGPASFQIAVLPVDGELLSDNNVRDIEINVTRSDIKVLLADELPRWEYRYLAQLFRRDAKVELDELLYRPRQIATGRRESSKSFPVDVDDWNHYDVVILGDLSTEHLSTASQTSLVDYVRSRGGTVILIAGDRAMPQAYGDHPLGDVLPVKRSDIPDDPQGYAFEVTAAGQSHAALMIGETHEATRESWEFVNEFSPLHRVSAWRHPLATATSLIAATPRSNLGFQNRDSAEVDADPSTFLCWQQVGRGRVIYLSGPDTYRLRFLRGDGLHYRFWGQLMRWAIASDLGTGNHMVRIRTGRTVYPTEESVDIEVKLGGDEFAVDELGDTAASNTAESTDEIMIRISGGEQERLVPLAQDEERPGVYRAEISDLPAGDYQAVPFGPAIDRLLDELSDSVDPDEAQEEAVAKFAVHAPLSAERVDTRCNRALAGEIAELTGGQVLPPTAVAEVLELTDLQPVVTHKAQRTPLWSRWKYLWLVFGCLQTEWVVRKWKGLS